VFSLEPSKHQIIKCGSFEVPDVYENERWNKLSVVQNDSHCSWICPYTLCYGLIVWLWTWRLKYLKETGKSMPSRLSAHSSRLESWERDDECENRATRGSATDEANKNRATRGSATDGASNNRATRGSATVGGPVAEARQEFRAAGARARLSPKEARRWTNFLHVTLV
jgi:hypothetical protein